MSPSPASIRFFQYADGSHCNVFSCYLIKIVVVVVVVVDVDVVVVVVAVVVVVLLLLRDIKTIIVLSETCFAEKRSR